jgi:Flp pilus assembly secretin CpaC
MKQREWCGFVGWLLAASLVALQARLVHAAEVPATAVALSRGDTYVIKGVSADCTPQIKAIDNPNALIVNKQTDGSVLVLGADAGSETVTVTMADGQPAAFTITVRANVDPKNPLVGGGSAPKALGDSGTSSPLDSGTGPSSSAGSGPLGTTATAPGPVAAADSASPAPAASTAPGATPGASSDTAGAPAPAAGAASKTTADSGSAAAGPSPSSGGVIPSQTASQKPEGSGAAAASNPPTPAGTEGSMTASTESTTKVFTDPRSNDEAAQVATKGAHHLPDDAIAMMFGTSRLFDFPRRIKRVSIADSDIADLQVINPHQLMLIGHKPGFTTLAVWDDQGTYQERQVRIEQTGHQQVLLNCTVAELNRSRLENQGINFSGALSGAGLSLVGLPGQVATPYAAQSNINGTGASSSSSGFPPGSGSSSGGILPFGGALIPMLLSSNLTYGLATANHSGLTQTFFQFLEAHQLARIMAEPRLLANSGEEAKFLVGGEIPIVIAQALNTSVVFKQFGTSVVFLPTVVGRNDIELLVKPEVSEPDYAHGVQLFGFSVPAFVTRRAETLVQMKDNQTLIIAGLILHEKKTQIQKVPYLGDIPYVSGLFRTTGYSNTETDLVMSVTPQIVQPLPDGASVYNPTSQPDLTPQSIETRRLAQPDITRPRF